MPKKGFTSITVSVLLCSKIDEVVNKDSDKWNTRPKVIDNLVSQYLESKKK